MNQQGYNYLAIGGSLNNTQVIQQFPVTRIEVDVNGQPQSYRKLPITVFDKTFEVLIYEPLATRNDLSAALAQGLLSPHGLSLWEQGAPITPQQPVGDGVAATTQQPAVDDASR